MASVRGKFASIAGVLGLRAIGYLPLIDGTGSVRGSFASIAGVPGLRSMSYLSLE